MTQNDATKRFLNREKILLATYVAFRAELVKWMEKDPAKPKILHERPSVRHTIMVGGWTITIKERLPDGASIANSVAPFKFGDTVVFVFDAIVKDKGDYEAVGTLEALTA